MTARVMKVLHKLNLCSNVNVFGRRSQVSRTRVLSVAEPPNLVAEVNVPRSIIAGCISAKLWMRDLFS